MSGANERTVYILLTDTGTWFTRMIRLYTKDSYNHASLAFDEELTEVYSFGRRRPNNPFVAGFVRENLRGEFFRNADCSVFACRVNETSYLKMKERIAQMEGDASRYRYNLLGVFAVMLKVVELEREDAFFCSEFVATLLSESGIRVGDKPPCRVTPGDLANGRAFQRVYEGELFPYLYGEEQTDSGSTWETESSTEDSIRKRWLTKQRGMGIFNINQILKVKRYLPMFK
ncbi:hypothetical protein [Gorillibacterium sp. CAU 1737]|uniref:hypothetical protein n=1 Tax=Gorillibacterium sp. CAU 1737 TaxID=3140362 RepID=UPI0032608445